MATRPRRTTKSQPYHGPTLFWIVVVLGLMGTLGYFGFVNVGQ